MESKGSISLIVPCYNIADVCDKFFESLLNQTYKNIEIICVNDGSIDKTEEKLLGYKTVFENVGFKFLYIYQENKGLGGAINTGLKYFSGDYLCWADPDDYFTENSFEVRLKAFHNNNECDIVIGEAYYGDINEPINCNKLLSKRFSNIKKPNQFYYLIDGDSLLCSGSYMIKTSYFDKVNPEREIFEAKFGQNYQMLLPVYYEGKALFVETPVYFYNTFNLNSMSHQKKNSNQMVEEQERQYLTICKTVDSMLVSEQEKRKIIKHVEKNKNNNILSFSISHNDKKLFKFYLKKALSKHLINIQTMKILLRSILK